MSDLHAARDTVSSHISNEATRHFDVALHGAVKKNLESMAELRQAVFECVDCLKLAKIGPVQMILAMKACALDSSGRHRPDGNVYPATDVDMLMDQIVRWAIVKYYDSVS